MSRTVSIPSPRRLQTRRRRNGRRPRPTITDLLIGWRHLPHDQLADRVHAIRQRAVTEHLDPLAWRTVDQMRRWLGEH